ncbi:putative membrane protein [Escherichia coli 2-474-04_S1_C1]|nr:putative membrane protein [Escherichia coli 2-474-04_S1_C1]CTP95315.1 hypothetical protein EC1094_2808 [Escherichia coli]SMZ47472.1 hypothetical protein EC1094V2_4379 [Escherichia coli]
MTAIGSPKLKDSTLSSGVAALLAVLAGAAVGALNFFLPLN